MQDKNINIEAGTLYDFNKQIMQDKKRFPPLSSTELDQIQKKLAKWFSQIDQYAMLLCNDIHYYTVFNLLREENDGHSERNAAKEVIACLEDQEADIISIEPIEPQDDSTGWEIWIRKEEPLVFYLFDYEFGVIPC